MLTSPAAANRSKVKPVGRTVTDAEVLTPEHDELLLLLHQEIACACDALFGVPASDLDAFEESALRAGQDYVRARINQLEKLRAEGSTYSALIPTPLGGRPADERQPSQAVLDAAARAIENLQKVLTTAEAPDLLAPSLVAVDSVTLRAQLTETRVREGYEPKITAAGYVDVHATYWPTPVIANRLELEGAAVPSLRDAAGFGPADESKILRTLQQLTQASLAYLPQLAVARARTALFSVRSGHWTVGEVIEEMRNLRSTDQGEEAEIVLVAQRIPPSIRAILVQQGLHCLDQAELVNMGGGLRASMR